jgi:hypothetical protein
MGAHQRLRKQTQLFQEISPVFRSFNWSNARTKPWVPQINLGDLPMKTVSTFTMLTLVLLFMSAYGISQNATKDKPATTTENLVRGVIGPVASNNSWANYSVMNVIPGSALFPVTSSTTVFYLGYTAGTEADISNMVVYTTARGSLKVTAVTPVKLGGTSSPSIELTSTSVCPTQPISTTNPCIVRLDPTTLTMSPASDYYLVIYYTNDSNNSAVGAAQGTNAQSTMAGTYFGGTDYTRLTAGQSLPGAPNGGTEFLMYVMNN